MASRFTDGERTRRDLAKCKALLERTHSLLLELRAYETGDDSDSDLMDEVAAFIGVEAPASLMSPIGFNKESE